jgi:hypothetical protein
MNEDRVCEVCEKNVKGDFKLCYTCYQEFGAPVIPNLKICVKCGKRNVKGVFKCCYNCNMENKLNLKVCKKCGKKNVKGTFENCYKCNKM